MVEYLEQQQVSVLVLTDSDRASMVRRSMRLVPGVSNGR